jgi:LacI family gluconate utilization system Gnt-I transcriptional repressor
MSQEPSHHRPRTIADVARAAGVSPMTVSKVLRGTGRISEETQARVRRLADEMGYVPNGLAGALSSQTSRLVGVLIPSVSDQVYAEVLSGINAVLNPRGLTGLIGETFFDPATEERLIRTMLSMQPAGLIISGGINRTAAALRLLRQGGPRSVQIWDGDRPDLDATVGLSHVAVGQLAAQTFLSVGLRDCCYIGAELARDLCAAQRCEGFLSTLRQAGASARSFTADDLPRNAEGGRVLTERLLGQGPLPSALHYLNDAMATGGLRALLAAGIAVPDAVSVIGFNGTSLRHAIRTRLTTIEVPLAEVGRRAAEAVIRQDHPAEPERVELVGMHLNPGTTVRGLSQGRGHGPAGG